MRLIRLGCLTLIVTSFIACGEGDRVVGENDSNESMSGGRAGRGGATSSSDAIAGNAGAGVAATGGAPAGEVRNCGVVPINPNATQQAKNLLCYLYEIRGAQVLSGQQETSWASNPAEDVEWIFAQTGKYPAILGGDYLYMNGTTLRAKAWWNAGGIPMIRYHMGAPPAADTYEDSKGSANLDAVLTAGTTENTSFNSKLDYAAQELKVLQNANVAVLWAPLHEAQPNGWFWWSKGTGEQFVAIWKYVYQYLTNTKGINNLVWLMPFSGSPYASFYPGKDYVDLAGPDTYDKTTQPFEKLYKSTVGIIGTELPVPLHETGVVPSPESMFPTAAPWVLFSIWAGFERDTNYNSVASIQAAYASPYTITRDEVPNLR